MRNIAAILLGAVLVGGSAGAGTLDVHEIAQLKSEIVAMYGPSGQGDAKTIVAKTHESLYRVFGGKDALEKIMQQGLDKMLGSEVRLLERELGIPTRTYLAGEEEVCFVPNVTTMLIDKKRIKSTSFMVAIRKLGSLEWRFLDGSGFQKRPEMLYQLLPQLEKGIVLPPVSVALL